MSDIEEKGKVFVKNIPHGTEKDELINLFSSIGPLQDVVLPKIKSNVNFKYFYAFISFKDEADAQKAITQLHDFLFCNAKGTKGQLIVVQAFMRSSNSSLIKDTSNSSLWSLGSLDSDKSSTSSDACSSIENTSKDPNPSKITAQNCSQTVQSSQLPAVQDANADNIAGKHDSMMSRIPGKQDSTTGQIPRKQESNLANAPMQNIMANPDSQSVKLLEDSKSLGAKPLSRNTAGITTEPMKKDIGPSEWMEERKELLEIIVQNDLKITDLKKKRNEELTEVDLEKREKELLEELEKLPKKIHTLQEEIEVLKLQVKLKELEKEQNQILSK